MGLKRKKCSFLLVDLVNKHTSTDWLEFTELENLPAELSS